MLLSIPDRVPRRNAAIDTVAIMRTLLLLVVLAPALAHAQDVPPPTAPPAPPPEAPAPPPRPPAPTPVAAPPTTPRDACRTRRHELEEQAAHTTDLDERTRILQSLPDCAHPPAVLPPLPAESTAPAAPRFDVAEGFAIELQLETGTVQLDNNSGLSLPQPGIFLGYRLPAGATLGLGIDFTRIGASTDTGTASGGTDTTTFLIEPGVRLPITHGSDGRTELLVRADLGYGQLSSSMSGSTTDSPSTQHIRVQAAPAVRFWVSRSFGVGAAAGLRYDRLSLDTSAGGMTSSTAQSTLGLFSSFHVVGVF